MCSAYLLKHNIAMASFPSLPTHAYTVKRNLLGQKRSIWGAIEGFEKSSTDFAESVSSVRNIPGVK